MQRGHILKYSALLLFLVISAFFVANVELSSNMWPISLAAIVLFSAPVVVGAVQWLGWKRGGVLIILLGLYAFVFESVAVLSGLPYGEFAYSDLLGPKVFDLVPIAVFMAWTPLVLGVVSIGFAGRSLIRIVAATILLVLIDSVLDPAAVFLGFWGWQQGGIYYGVPLINFMGWVISGGIAVACVASYIRKTHDRPAPYILRFNLLAIIVFWSLVNLFALQLAPFIIGVLLVGLLIVRFDALYDKSATLKR